MQGVGFPGAGPAPLHQKQCWGQLWVPGSSLCPLQTGFAHGFLPAPLQHVCSFLAAGNGFCLRGPSIFQDTNFVVYRSVLGLRANLGRWPIFSSFSCLFPLASGDLERKHPSFQEKVSRENDTISSDRIWKTQSWLRDSMRQEKEMAVPLDFRLCQSVDISVGLSSEL